MWLLLILIFLFFAAATLLKVLKNLNSVVFFLAFILSLGTFFTIGTYNVKTTSKLPSKVDEIPIYFMKDVKTDRDPFVIGIKDISTNSFYFYLKDGNLLRKMDLKVENLKVVDKDVSPMLTAISKTDVTGWLSLGLSGSTSYQIRLPVSLVTKVSPQQ
jgi:hypothetical protein